MMLRSGRNKAQFAALLVPGIIVFALFTVYPIVKLFVMSFLRWDLGSVFQKSFAGFENYKAVLSDETFFIAFENTLIYTLVTVPGQMALGLLAAVLIHSIPRFQVTFRVIYYIPVITSWVIVSLVFRYIFNTEGMLNYFLCNVLHLTKDYVPWLNTRWGGLTVAMLLGIWKGVGWNLVVFRSSPCRRSFTKRRTWTAAPDGKSSGTSRSRASARRSSSRSSCSRSAASMCSRPSK